MIYSLCVHFLLSSSLFLRSFISPEHFGFPVDRPLDDERHMLPIDPVVVGVPDIALHIVGTGDNSIVSIDWLVLSGVQGRKSSCSLSLAGSLSSDGCGADSGFARFVATRGSLVIFIDNFGNIIDNFGNIIDNFGNIIDDLGNIIDDFGNIIDDFGNIIGSRTWDIGYLRR
ncbi:hypothetical protein K440DRAFT_642051 [Wilcoxina mikolae CBS 423.85]|nr:hypothetical protein K440DRAFT_642051 [Wilcoxina mikolae CBS 423.85]